MRMRHKRAILTFIRKQRLLTTIHICPAFSFHERQAYEAVLRWHSDSDIVGQTKLPYSFAAPHRSLSGPRQPNDEAWHSAAYSIVHEMAHLATGTHGLVGKSLFAPLNC